MPERPPHHEEDNQWVGEQIRKFRKLRDMTQTELAEAIGDPRYQKYVSDYENGSDHMPIPVFFAIIEALGASPTDLTPPRLYREELEVFEKFRRLNPEHRDMVKSMIETMLKAEGKT